ncbi:MAG: hypothetical protein IJD13_03755 [Oscillospiraceae bacterium]|nr:hypothetical protein [Oscillospiraceae bacterium]
MDSHSFRFRTLPAQAETLSVYNAEHAPFRLYGLYPHKQDGLFARMPKEIAGKISEKVSLLYTNTAGARLRFATDSRTIAVGAVYPPMTFPSERSVALSGAGACCFDLYVDGAHCQVMSPAGLIQRGSVMSYELSDGQYESAVSFEEKRMRQITLCFPSFVNISDLFIGLDKDAVLTEGTRYVNALPVVFYGSSITQGACASRSGNTYPNILSRRFSFDYINLGFAGACKAEEPAIDYLCSLPMQLLVYDYDHNTPSVEFLRETHLRGLRKLREAHPDLPIVLLSKPNQHNGKEEAIRRMRVIEESYRALQKESAAPVHFIDGQQIFESHDREMMTMDNTHPTDLGFYCMAEALSDVFKLYF